MYELYNSILVRPHLDVIQRRYVNGKYHRLTTNVSIESSSFPFLYLYPLFLSFSLFIEVDDPKILYLNNPSGYSDIFS